VSVAVMDTGRDSTAALVADHASDLPVWRDRLERLWVRQVTQVTELSLAFHDAAADPRSGNLALAEAHVAQMQGLLDKMASAHHGLTEIEEALRRLDDGRYGICEHCGAHLPPDCLAAAPQARYCPRCRNPDVP
jgi:DnaK suppressor protein